MAPIIRPPQPAPVPPPANPLGYIKFNSVDAKTINRAFNYFARLEGTGDAVVDNVSPSLNLNEARSAVKYFLNRGYRDLAVAFYNIWRGIKNQDFRLTGANGEMDSVELANLINTKGARNAYLSYADFLG